MPLKQVVSPHGHRTSTYENYILSVMALISDLLDSLYSVNLIRVCKALHFLPEQHKKKCKQNLILYFFPFPLGIPWLISSLANSLAESIKDQPIKYSGPFFKPEQPYVP